MKLAGVLHRCLAAGQAEVEKKWTIAGLFLALESSSYKQLMSDSGYRGRLAPTPTGRLHLGHALTFWTAFERCRKASGRLVYRNEDLDWIRCRPEFAQAAIDDLRWLGIDWDEGVERDGPHRPYDQGARTGIYRAAWDRLRQAGAIYPCRCSRRDLRLAAQAPHDEGREPLYPGTCRPNGPGATAAAEWPDEPGTGEVCWRFRVPDGLAVTFEDGGFGRQCFTAGRDFGDFVVWRRDGVPAYELAVVADDAAMGITEVVRGADLLLSTARQLLIYGALELSLPSFYHTPLVMDGEGRRLAKRDRAASIESLKEGGYSAEQVLAMARERTMLGGDDRS